MYAATSQPSRDKSMVGQISITWASCQHTVTYLLQPNVKPVVTALLFFGL
jgi:hypothetical protein